MYICQVLTCGFADLCPPRQQAPGSGRRSAVRHRSKEQPVEQKETKETKTAEDRIGPTAVVPFLPVLRFLRCLGVRFHAPGGTTDAFRVCLPLLPDGTMSDSGARSEHLVGPVRRAAHGSRKVESAVSSNPDRVGRRISTPHSSREPTCRRSTAIHSRAVISRLRPLTTRQPGFPTDSIRSPSFGNERVPFRLSIDAEASFMKFLETQSFR